MRREGGREMISATSNEILVTDRVNSLIHENLTDMWLLLTGEALHESSRSSADWDGRPLAMTFGGQVRMLEGKVEALETLRFLGIEMS